ncbi:sulfurtransferase [Oryzomicrobium sp.]|uniref:sulfurtransferase n=1 Tax=Oryzomicrobium sp. TaxID=1911578 RepID=UPI002FE025E6
MLALASALHLTRTLDASPARILRTLAVGLFCAAGLVLHAAPSHAADGPAPAKANAAAQPGGRIVDIAQVEAAIARGAIVWDVRSADDYKRGHLPGAINFGDAGKVLRDEQREDFLPTAAIAKAFGDAGLDPRQEVVVYGGRGNAYAYFGGYAVRYFGGRNVSVFHDGFEGWQEAGKPVSTESHQRPKIALTLAPNPAIAATTDEVVKRFNAPGVQVLDVRTRKEFSGDDIRAIRGGHIPGAISIPVEQNWQDPEAPQKLAKKEAANTAGLALKDRSALEALYKDLDRNKETIVYCQSGVRASETAAVLETLGFKEVKVYDSSWLGWAAKLSAPVENETFLNVGALTGQLNAQINALKRRVDELEKQLAKK